MAIEGKSKLAAFALKEQLGLRLAARMEVDGFVIDADPFDGPGYSFWRDGFDESATRTLLAQALQPGMVTFDIGADARWLHL